MRGAWVAAAAAVVALILAGHEWSYHHTHADTGPSLVIAILALTVAALAAVVVWLVRETRRIEDQAARRHYDRMRTHEGGPPVR